MLTRTCCIAAVMLLALAQPARAEDAAIQARKLFKEAEVHFNLQEFERALELYKRAYKLKPLPGFLFNIGQCQRYLGQYQEALFSYRVYLERVPRAPNRTQVRALIKETEGLLDQQQAGENPERPRPPPRGEQQPAPEETKPVEPDDPNSFDNRGPRALPVWVGVSVTAALLATGVVTGQMTSNRAEEYAEVDTSLERRRELKDSGERLRTGSIVAFSLAGASAVATAVYYFLVYRPAKRAWRERRTLSLTPSAGGLTLTGAF